MSPRKSLKRALCPLNSSVEWHNQVAESCLAGECIVKPNLVHVDIGPVGDWGFPIDKSTKERWPSYYQTIWKTPAASDADLYLVDGRFRVASFMSVLLHCKPDAIIMIHDFSSREGYHVIKEVAREIARAEDLSVFTPAVAQSRALIHELLTRHRFESA